MAATGRSLPLCSTLPLRASTRKATVWRSFDYCSTSTGNDASCPRRHSSPLTTFCLATCLHSTWTTLQATVLTFAEGSVSPRSAAKLAFCPQPPPEIQGERCRNVAHHHSSRTGCNRMSPNRSVTWLLRNVFSLNSSFTKWPCKDFAQHFTYIGQYVE